MVLVLKRLSHVLKWQVGKFAQSRRHTPRVDRVLKVRHRPWGCQGAIEERRRVGTLKGKAKTS